MTHRITAAQIVEILDDIVLGSSLDQACEKHGFAGRTLQRRATKDPSLRARIDDAVQEREANKERVPHGVYWRYAHGCRCLPCKDAYLDYSRLRAKQRRNEPIPAFVKHGTYGAYTNWSCRCDDCRAAHRAHERAAYERRRNSRVPARMAPSPPTTATAVGASSASLLHASTARRGGQSGDR